MKLGKLGLVSLTASLIGTAPAPGGTVVVEISGLRSAKGQVLACLTARAKSFPDCTRDPAARKLAVPSREAATLRFAAVPPGRYAVALLDDANGNGKADMALFIPREGFGFSRDAAAPFGPPKFAAAAFDVGAEPVSIPIRMRYVF
ncbi:DUF2141 domain-containing protein [Novosphingobium sp. Gsoil 351]|uniref:DUF2141 domain-containing protein n=1 Tax=Novosphingobium sp. Gsoil 351 TaxID=2675225 RepID=UPI0012B4869A|nr:DUF2141 domain-containing protein [Novosphingobium sp. Gsoil 351]QGN55122.1 DUF2141 domain-containing protein [Novosphingobium sp. Gsoil 351]